MSTRIGTIGISVGVGSSGSESFFYSFQASAIGLLLPCTPTSRPVTGQGAFDILNERYAGARSRAKKWTHEGGNRQAVAPSPAGPVSGKPTG